MTNIYEINDLIDFLEEHEITIKQFMYCMLLYYDKKFSKAEGKDYISRPLSKLYKYYENVEKFKKSEIQDLIDKKFLDHKGGELKLDLLEVTEKFEKKWLGDQFKIKELIDVYPKRVPNFNHPGKPPIPLCIFNDYERLKKRYNSLVKTYKMHNRVIELVEWGKENERINLGIEKFVNSKYWEQLETMMHEGSSDNYSMI